jgi:hypothetical protein
MSRKQAVHRVRDLFDRSKTGIPAEPGVYAFWWCGERAKILSGSLTLRLKGPKGNVVTVMYGDWWPKDLPYPCLYVGKSTNLRARFRLHIKNGSPGRLHDAHPEHHKAEPRTTSCQLRWGIEHVFPDELDPLTLIHQNVGFSWSTDFRENAVAERFYAEDLLVGTWRPWFNIDSER